MAENVRGRANRKKRPAGLLQPGVLLRRRQWIYQPNLDEMIALANNYAVIERSDRGIGYVILQRKDAKPTN